MAQTPDIFDVLIVGAGLSGIGCACHLKRELPQKSVVILESRDDLGGTWDLFRYPGIRSDSDLLTFGYKFRPWRDDKTIADGPSIKAYLRDTAEEYGVDRLIRFGTRVTEANWDSGAGCWIVSAETAGGETRTLRARWLFGATGFYDYEQGYRPKFPGEARFAGEVVHPQHWPEDLAVEGRRIAVIGSGATAVTLVPALAETAAHVTQVQRTPTYVMPVPSRDGLYAKLVRWLPADRAFAIARRKNVLQQKWVYEGFQRFPGAARRLIARANRRALPKGFDVARHFSPPYDPWDQRLCAVPDGDFFKALSDGSASIVTGDIETFTESGLQLADGTQIEADVIVTATGLSLKLFGGVALRVDGDVVELSDRLVFRGMMLDSVPNFAFAVGYTNASWTLKVGLVCEYFCRLLALADEKGATRIEAKRPDGSVETRPLLDFEAGYVKRSLDMLPKQGAAFPWIMTFDYIDDEKQMKRGPVDHSALHFGNDAP